MKMVEVIHVPTKPFEGQKLGTSGLRKKTKVFMQENYLHNFIQSVFDSLNPSLYTNGTLLVSGDGRYFSMDAIQIIAEIAFANNVNKIWIGKGGLVSTPAASAIIREREDGKCFGGFLLTASHNPGGEHEDFGIKYNTDNGGPSPESLTNKIYENTKNITEYKIVKMDKINVDEIGEQKFCNGKFIVEVIDPVEDWLKLIKNIFDFSMIKNFLKRKDFSMVYDGMHGVAGPYAKRLFVDEFKMPETVLLNCQPKLDFGGGHPDPNLTYAKDLVDRMKVFDTENADESTPVFGAAGDGDCDRNMILGRGFFVTPSDSLAIISYYSIKCIPYFMKCGLYGLSRSMPTAKSVDAVAKLLNVSLYETPTGWKYFGNLMDAKKISICGEESFGTGSDHIREKDGLWAVLAWLNILSYENSNPNEKLVHVKDIVFKLWKLCGRFFYCRYDYEGVQTTEADNLMNHLRKYVINLDILQRDFRRENLKVIHAEEFCYVDPVDKSVTENQGIIFHLESNARIIWRLSGTGSSGSTIRLYLEKGEEDSSKFNLSAATALKDIGEFAIKLGKVEYFTGRNEPTVIT